MDKKILEIKIEKIAKKLNTFQAEDIEVLTEAPKIEVVSTIEKMISKGVLKSNNDIFTLVPKTIKPKKKEDNFNINKQISSIKVLPFRPKKPKEVYLRHINEMDGFANYFFATQARKDKIKRILTVLKESHGLSNEKLKEVLKKHQMGEKRYFKYKNEISRNGLKNLVEARNAEPGEIFYFFKEYYLSTKKYTSEEARELAILRFERLIGMKINHHKITIAHFMLRRLKKEYSNEEIERFRTVNFSEFDVEKMFHE